jgi:hypothetical protein
MATKQRTSRTQTRNSRTSNGTSRSSNGARRTSASNGTTRQPWTEADLRRLRQLAKENTPTRVMGIKLGRTPAAVYQKAAAERISLKPVNQSPYGRQR